MSSKKIEITQPRYQKIAFDLANQIAKGKYAREQRIYSRTSIASQYQVSAETARRAVAILADLGIVQTTKGSGVTILSQEKAIEYITRNSNIQPANQLKIEIMEDMAIAFELQKNIQNKLLRLFDKTERYKSINPLLPYEIKITKSMKFLTQTIAEINFWHYTGATVIGIIRDEKLIISPGPYATFMENDLFLFIGDENANARVTNFLYHVD